MQPKLLRLLLVALLPALSQAGGSQPNIVIVFADDSHLVEPSNDELIAKLAELEAAGFPPERAGGAVVENTTLGRFELLRAGDVVSFATYRTDAEGRVVIPHVETAPQHRGNGYAAELMDGTLELIRSTGRKVVPLCPFAAGHIRDNPEHHDLVG